MSSFTSATTPPEVDPFFNLNYVLQKIDLALSRTKQPFLEKFGVSLRLIATLSENHRIIELEQSKTMDSQLQTKSQSSNHDQHAFVVPKNQAFSGVEKQSSKTSKSKKYRFILSTSHDLQGDAQDAQKET